MQKTVFTSTQKRYLRGEDLSREEVAEFTAYVRREGRVTIPKELRDALIIKEGNLVKCKIVKMGTH
jgi:AbrB family looped-hinge helix DNA binding protein